MRHTKKATKLNLVVLYSSERLDQLLHNSCPELHGAEYLWYEFISGISTG